MVDKNAVFMTRHIGNTTYKVRVYLSETAEETMEDKNFAADPQRRAGKPAGMWYNGTATNEPSV